MGNQHRYLQGQENGLCDAAEYERHPHRVRVAAHHQEIIRPLLNLFPECMMSDRQGVGFRRALPFVLASNDKVRVAGSVANTLDDVACRLERARVSLAPRSQRLPPRLAARVARRDAPRLPPPASACMAAAPPAVGSHGFRSVAPPCCQPGRQRIAPCAALIRSHLRAPASPDTSPAPQSPPASHSLRECHVNAMWWPLSAAGRA